MIPRPANPDRNRGAIDNSCGRPTTHQCFFIPEHQLPLLSLLGQGAGAVQSNAAVLATDARSTFIGAEGPAARAAQTHPGASNAIPHPRCRTGLRPLKISHQYNTSTPASAIVHNARIISVGMLTDIVRRTTTAPTAEKEYEFIRAVAFALHSLQESPREQERLDHAVRLALVSYSICNFFNAVSWNEVLLLVPDSLILTNSCFRAT